MLTGYQCEVIAFVTDGEIICRDCAVLNYGQLTIEKAEDGLETSAEISPLIRYSVDELDRSYEYAEERVDEFLYDHPSIELTDNQRWRLTDRRAERRPAPECCGACGKELS